MYIIFGAPAKLKCWPGPYIRLTDLHRADMRNGLWRAGNWCNFENATLFTEEEMHKYIADAKVKDTRWFEYCEVRAAKIHPLNVPNHTT